MSSNPSLLTIADLVEKGEASIQTGPFGTQLKASDYTDQGTPVINVRNIGYGDIRPAALEYLPDHTKDRLAAHILQTGDIVFGRKGAVDRHVLISPEQNGWVQGSDCIRLRIDSEQIDERFLSYYFQTPAHKYWMESQGSFGATMASLNQGIISRISFPNYPLPTQHKIAAILTSYDELIETNRRRIALLERLAEQIYREWFVRLRFPGHTTTPIHKGVPEGWKFIPVEQAFDFTGGGTPSKKVHSYWNPEEINWFTPTDITGAEGIFLENSGIQCSEEGLSRSSAKLFPPYSVMMTSRATIGAIGINRTPAATNQGFITCIPNQDFPLPYLYHWLKLSKPYFEMIATGSTFLELTRGTFKKVKILKPATPITQKFKTIVDPIFQAIETSLTQNTHLTHTRDLLLNRLISGTLRVDDLPIHFPPSMRLDKASSQAHQTT